MPAVDTVLLPLCVGLTLLGVIATGIAWRRGNKGRVVQWIGLALAPVALYFSGLLRLLWDGAVAIGSWASAIVFSPAVWFGLSGPAGLAPEIVNRLSGEVRRIVQLPEVRARFRADGIEPAAAEAKAFGTFIAAEIERWTPVVRASGARPD